MQDRGLSQAGLGCGTRALRDAELETPAAAGAARCLDQRAAARSSAVACARVRAAAAVQHRGLAQAGLRFGARAIAGAELETPAAAGGSRRLDQRAAARSSAVACARLRVAAAVQHRGLAQAGLRFGARAMVGAELETPAAPATAELFPEVRDDASLWTRMVQADAFLPTLRGWARFCDLPDSFCHRLTLHGFRSGGCSDAVNSGRATVQEIMRQGRWTSHCLEMYIHMHAELVRDTFRQVTCDASLTLSRE